MILTNIPVIRLIIPAIILFLGIVANPAETYAVGTGC
jgi:hypothetical protein